MKLNSVKDKLPEDRQYVLIHLTKGNWGDDDDPKGNRYWKVAKFKKGISESDRDKLPIDHPKKLTWSGEDEGFNNRMPYNWQPFGPGSYFGQEVDFWCELPELPE